MKIEKAIPRLAIFQVLVAVVAIALTVMVAVRIPPLLEQRAALEHDIANLTNVRDSYQAQIEKAKKEAIEVADKSAQLCPADTEEQRDLRAAINAIPAELQAALPVTSAPPVQPLPAAIEKLFAPSASERAAAYSELMSGYARSPDLVPALLSYAEQHRDNANGIYNTLVVLSHVNHKALGSDVGKIRGFATSVRGMGPKTDERVDKLLGRLPS